MKKIIVIACVWLAGTVSAQNTTNVPTSMYGLGELVPTSGGQYAGMGSVGVALNRNSFLNTRNPAAITQLDSTCFIFDFGLAASQSQYSMLSDRSTSTMGNPNRVTLGGRVMPHWFAMVGVAPYSSVGYLIRMDQEVEGTDGATVPSLFKGTGGLYRFYASNAFSLSKQLSVGVNLGYVSGNIHQSESQESTAVQRESHKGAFYADLGLHYRQPLSKERTLSWGLTYAFPTKLLQENTMSFASSSTSESYVDNFYDGKQYLPQYIAVGLALETYRWVLTGDYDWSQWSRNESPVKSVTYENQHKLSVGSIYTLQPRNQRSVELMMGAGYGNSYLSIKGGKTYNMDLNAGLLIPLRRSILSVGGTWSRSVSSKKNQMQVSTFLLNFNLTFRERVARAKLY